MISMIPPNFVLLIKKTKTMQKNLKTILSYIIVGTFKWLEYSGDISIYL